MEKEKKYQTRTIYETLAPYDVVKVLQWLDIITMREVATFQASVANEDYLSIEILLIDDLFNPVLFKECMSQNLRDNWDEQKVEVDKLIETINQAIVDKIEVLSIYSI